MSLTLRAGTRQRPVYPLQERHEIAADLDVAGHVGFAEVEFRIPDPAEQSGARTEADGGDGRARRRNCEAVPELEADRRRGDELLDPRERPAIEAGGRTPGGTRRPGGYGRHPGEPIHGCVLLRRQPSQRRCHA